MLNRVKVEIEITLYSLEHTVACRPVAGQRPREISKCTAAVTEQRLRKQTCAH
jgi:hypothetical protein